MNTTRDKAVLTSLFYSLLLLCVLVSSTVHATNITVTSSRNPVALDDSFHLIYEADSSVDDAPDFSPIYQYFDVLSSSQSTNMRSVNGSWSLKKTWDLSVIAKDVGKITVPAISFGSDLSPAIQITVRNSTSPGSASPDNQSSIPAKIFLESSIDKKQGWVQSQFIYNIRLFRTVSITGASITDPVTSDPDAIIQQLSEDKYQTTRNGLRYEVFERRYAIFPQKSGRLKIDPVTFVGRINSTQPRNIFDQFRMSGQLKRLRSKSIDVNVKAAPAAINLQDWLPASDVKIFEEWSDDIQKIKAGEPVTRTITIAARGLTAVQLPDLSFSEIKNLKQYPDKAITEDRQDTDGITGLKQIKVALIPVKAGSYTLPKIKLQWWNTRTNKAEVAEIPSITITATGTAPKIETPLPPPLITQSPKYSEQTTNKQNALPATADQSNNEPYWKWLSFFLAFAWLVTLVLLLKKPKSHATYDNNAKSSVKTAASNVVKHAKNNDTVKVKLALIEWAQLFYNDDDLTNLTQITEHCSPQLKTEIRQLNHVLYSTDKESWQGGNLLIAFKAEQSITKRKSDTSPSALKPLYNK